MILCIKSISLKVGHFLTEISKKNIGSSQCQNQGSLSASEQRSGIKGAEMKRCRSFFFKLIYFNWRIISLQHCGVFCHTLTWISHGYTCVPHPESPSTAPSPPRPSGWSQSTSFGCPVSCIELALYSADSCFFLCLVKLLSLPQNFTV